MKIRTILKLSLLGSSHGDHTRKPLRLLLLLVDLGAKLASLHAQLLRILLEGNELVSPEIGLGHQEIQTTRETTNLGLQVIAGIDEGRSAFADGKLNMLLSRSEARNSPHGAEGADTLEQRWLLELFSG